MPKGHNQYQTAEYVALYGHRADPERPKVKLYDLTFRGENVCVGVPYPVCVAKRKEKVTDFGWKFSLFKITRHI